MAKKQFIRQDMVVHGLYEEIVSTLCRLIDVRPFTVLSPTKNTTIRFLICHLSLILKNLLYKLPYSLTRKFSNVYLDLTLYTCKQTLHFAERRQL